MFDLAPLPRIESRTAAFLTRVSALHGVYGIGLGPEAAFLSMAPDLDTHPSGPTVRMPMTSPFGEVVLHLETALVDALSDALLPCWRQETAASLPLAWRVIAVVHHLAAGTPAGSFDWTCGEVTKSEALSPDRTRISLMLEWLGQPHWLALEVADVSDRALALIPDPTPRNLSADPLDVPVDVILTGVTVMLTEAVALAPGDVVLLPRAEARVIPACATISDTIGWSGHLTADGAFRPTSRLSKEQIMRDYRDEPDADPICEAAHTADEADLGLDEPTLAELPIHLDIRLQSRSLPLSAFAGLAPGAVLELDADLTGPLEILGNGRIVGTGRLVQLDQRIGVQIERWRSR
ncbi:MAG: FliM/FliN family flagellar motor switch protein [Pseudomonadota bacterium]